MALEQFLAEVARLFGLAIPLRPDAWYFAAVQAIGFLPQPQIEAILNAFGQYTEAGQYACGLTVMMDDGLLNRSVPQIWVAYPDEHCTVAGLRFVLDHELRHVWTWLVEGVTTWPGH